MSRYSVLSIDEKSIVSEVSAFTTDGSWVYWCYRYSNVIIYLLFLTEFFFIILWVYACFSMGGPVVGLRQTLYNPIVVMSCLTNWVRQDHFWEVVKRILPSLCHPSLPHFLSLSLVLSLLTFFLSLSLSPSPSPLSRWTECQRAER